MKGSAADVLVGYLEQAGIEYLFGMPGGHLLALYDAVHRSGKIKTVLTKNEQGAGYMANGYARVSGRPVVCICGDGDFQMTGMEVVTAATYQLPVVWVILNNSRLSMVYDLQGLSYQGRYEASTLQNPSFTDLARAMGATGYRVQRPGELHDVVGKALGSGKPSVIDVPIDPEELPPMKPRMLAIERSMGIPDTSRSITWKAFKALVNMLKER